MGEAIGQMLPMAIGAAISPFPIVGVVLMLDTPRGRVNGPAFILGTWIGLGVVGTVVLLLASGADAGEQAGAYAVFVLIGSIGVVTPVAIFFALGDRSRELLDGLKGWMIANNAAIMTVVLLVIAAKMIGDAITGFST